MTTRTARPTAPPRVAAPRIVSTKHNAKGDKLEVWSNGQQIETKRDGTIITRHAGGIHIKYPDGRTYAESKVDWAKKLVSETSAKHNKTTATYADGGKLWSESRAHDDGTIEHTKTARDKDGKQIQIYSWVRKPDGSSIEHGLDGTIRERLADGSTKETKNGVTFETSADGRTKTVRNTDGTFQTVRDGVVLAYRHADGSTLEDGVARSSDGTITHSKPDGSRVTHYADGSMEELKYGGGYVRRDAYGNLIMEDGSGGMYRPGIDEPPGASSVRERE